jgi:hypothetical protein
MANGAVSAPTLTESGEALRFPIDSVAIAYPPTGVVGNVIRIGAGDDVGKAPGIGVAVVVGVPVAVCVGMSVAVAVAVNVHIAVDVVVTVGVRVAVLVALRTAVGVVAGVLIGVAVGVPVLVEAAVGDAVRVGVGVRDGVGEDDSASNFLTAFAKTLKSMVPHPVARSNPGPALNPVTPLKLLSPVLIS